LNNLSRRSFALGTLGALVGCQRRSEASTNPRGASLEAGVRGSSRLLEWTFEGAVSTRTAVLVPTWGGGSARFPVLIALHGRGEARKPPAEGALGWPRDYALVHAMERVATPPLEPADFEGYVDAVRLDQLNQGLRANPFGGLIVACPHVPDLDLADDAGIAAFGGFLIHTLLPRLRRETPAMPSPAATGIDGVSLGGEIALAVGLDQSREFGAVGSLQPAIDAHDAARWTTRAQAARQANPEVALRLLTSDGDYFREAVRVTSSAWSAAGVAHESVQVLGPHDYPFNRGPGAIEMLVWHDRVLRRRA
jgi:hypothetical protein